MNPLAQLKKTTAFCLVVFALACFALSPTARAVSPAPDGGYPNNNTAEGDSALFSLTTGTNNTANGFGALYTNTAGIYNTANGSKALYSNTTINGASGNANTASGVNALFSNITGSNNTANGVDALYYNTTGNYNTANGSSVLYHNTTGIANTATGVNALYANTTGYDNTANGYEALLSNATGYGNTATGFFALNVNTTGTDNTATGFYALSGNDTGIDNTATGGNALYSNTTGSRNTANGLNVLHNNTTGDSNTANGIGALYNNTTGNANIALGRGAGGSLTTGSGNIDIANPGVAAEANTIRIGTASTQTNAYIAGIYGATVGKGLGVIIDANGHLGTVVSSKRFKDQIKPMDKASEAILALQPVTFHYKKELDPDGVPQFGLIAEQVERINPDLVLRDAEGKVNAVRYEAVNAMLLNEFLKEHRTVQALKSTVAEQQKQIKALASGLEKVSAQLELNKPGPRTVVNNQ